MVYSTRRFVFSLALCYFVRVVFSLFSIAITSLWEERANHGAFRAFVRFALVWFCLFPLSLGVLEGLRLVIVALSGLSLTFCLLQSLKQQIPWLFRTSVGKSGLVKRNRWWSK